MNESLLMMQNLSKKSFNQLFNPNLPPEADVRVEIYSVWPKLNHHIVSSYLSDFRAIACECA